MECYQVGCGERPVWQVTFSYRSADPGATPVVLSGETGACWNHRAQLLRLYGGARGADGCGSVDVQHHALTAFELAGRPDVTKALLTPIFG